MWLLDVFYRFKEGVIFVDANKGCSEAGAEKFDFKGTVYKN